MSPPEGKARPSFSVALPYEVCYYFLVLPEASDKSSSGCVLCVFILSFNSISKYSQYYLSDEEDKEYKPHNFSGI